MGLFSTKVSEVSEERKSGSNQDYIYPGIKHAVTIHKVETGEAKTGTPFIELFFHTKEKGVESSKGIKLYITAKTADNVLVQLMHMATKVMTRKEFNEELDSTNVKTLAESFGAMMKGQFFRMKFNGQQYVNAAGDVRDNAKIPYSPEFAEAIQGGAEYEAVSDEDTKLTFDKTNQYDYKVLSESEKPTPESTVDNTVSGGIGDLV